MTSKGTGTFAFPKRGKTGMIFVPADITRDSLFPLKEGKVKISIQAKKIVVESIG